jgi:two-component system chemotaxis response regulator CheB
VSKPPPLTVVVADDSALYRQMLLNVLRRIDGVEVVGVAANGREAVDCVVRLRPDVLTLDVHMPVLNGIAVLRELRAAGSRARAIMVSSLTSEGAPATVEALLEGAFDYLPKPVGLEPHLAREAIHSALAEKLAFVRVAIHPPVAGPAIAPRPAAEEGSRRPVLPYDAIAIGTSTGGPETLRAVVPRLPKDLPVPVFIVQHMPPMFTATLAARLDELSAVGVVEAADGMKAEAGRVHVAPGGRHLRLAVRDRAPSCVIDDGAARLGCRPSFDNLLESMVEIYGGRIIAVVLTGMGCDGLDGVRRVKAKGGCVIAQAPETCCVYGMPKAIIEHGLADAVLPPDAIGVALAAGLPRATQAATGWPRQPHHS